MQAPRSNSRINAMAASLLLASALAAGCMSFHPGPLPDEPPDATFVQLGDTRVHYVDRAVGMGKEALAKPPVVLVHGFGASLTEWLGVIPALASAGHRVVALDLRGHGWTTRPDGDYSIEGQAKLVLALADQLGLKRFAIVGHSWGSAVVLQVTSMAPERVVKVALYNGMFFDDQQPTLFAWSRVAGLGELVYGVFYPERQDEKMAFAFFDPEKHVTEEIVEKLEAAMARPGTEAAALAGIRAMKFGALEKAYPRIMQPVLVQWGREDQVTPLEYGERLVNELPNAELHVVPRCGHLPMIEVPHATTNRLVRFLAAPAPVAFGLGGAR